MCILHYIIFLCKSIIYILLPSFFSTSIHSVHSTRIHCFNTTLLVLYFYLIYREEATKFMHQYKKLMASGVPSSITEEIPADLGESPVRTRSRSAEPTGSQSPYSLIIYDTHNFFTPLPVHFPAFRPN